MVRSSIGWYVEIFEVLLVSLAHGSGQEAGEWLYFIVLPVLG